MQFLCIASTRSPKTKIGSELRIFSSITFLSNTTIHRCDDDDDICYTEPSIKDDEWIYYCVDNSGNDSLLSDDQRRVRQWSSSHPTNGIQQLVHGSFTEK